MDEMSSGSDLRTLQLTAEERLELVTVLERSLQEVRVEARRTDDLEFRARVHHERELLERLLEKAQGT